MFSAFKQLSTIKYSKNETKTKVLGIEIDSLGILLLIMILINVCERNWTCVLHV